MEVIQVPERKITKWELEERQRKLEAFKQAEKQSSKATKKGKWKLYTKFLSRKTTT